MNLDVEKLTEKLQKYYNIPLRELRDIYEMSEAQTAEDDQVDLLFMQGSSSADAKSELLPCPFCGSEAIIIGAYSEGYAVECKYCRCAVGKEYDRDAMPNNDFCTEQEAINAWNKRASQ